MKNLILFISIVFWMSQTFAQIQIDKNDMPEPGEKPRFSIADTIVGFDPSPTGPNYRWDFSTLEPILQRTDSFVGRNDLPIAIRFSAPSDLSVAQYLETGDSLGGGGFTLSGGYDLFRTTDDAFEGLGQSTVLSGILPLNLAKDPIDTIYRFPMVYQQIDSSYSEAELDLNLPGLGAVYIYQERNRVNEVDGYGTLITPFGTFDVLRVKTTITGYDSLTLDTLIDIGLPAIPTVQYKWLGKNQGVPLLQINVTQLGGQEIPGQVVYRDSVREGVPTVSIDKDLLPLEASVYPNPTQDKVQITLGELNGKIATLRLVDMQGRIVVEQGFLDRSIQLDLSAHPAGVYILRIDREKEVFMGKIVKE